MGGRGLYPERVVGRASFQSFHSKEYRRFAEALADARRKAGVSQYQLADRLGVDQSFVSKYESGRRRLDVLEFLQIVAALGIDYRAVLDQLAKDDV